MGGAVHEGKKGVRGISPYVVLNFTVSRKLPQKESLRKNIGACSYYCILVMFIKSHYTLEIHTQVLISKIFNAWDSILNKQRKRSMSGVIKIKTVEME